MVAAVFMIIVSVLALLPETTTSIVLGGVSGGLSDFLLQVSLVFTFT